MTLRTRTQATAALALCALALLGAGCAPEPPEATVPPSIAPPTLAAPTPTDSETPAQGWWQLGEAAGTLASGLRAPWSVAVLPGGGALISERGDGTVRELTRSGELRIAGVVPGVVPGGEAGLHGLALWQNGPERWLYAYHGASEDNRVVRMPLTGADGALALGEAEVVFDGIARAGNHNGGRIAFGPDGFLYVTTGDAGDRDASQDPASPNGKILRLTPEGQPAPGNPFGTAVFSLGHRNVQGIAWTADGTMWASEFGQNTWDELNVIRPGGNYGWPVVEGDAGDARFVDPVAVWPTSEASPSGIAAVGDTVFMAALRGERLWVIDTAGGALAGDPRAVLVGEQGRLRDVVPGPGGTLLVLTNNTDGRGSPRDADDLLLSYPLTPRT